MTRPRERATLFLSDLHLSPSIPLTVAAFERFVDSIDATDVGEVYILGDLFEFWIGDDMMRTPFAAEVVARLATLRARGIRLFVMHGNRDFLLGKRFARAAGAVLIPDPFPIAIGNERWLLTHGDALCTDDLQYQRFRRIVRRRWVQWFFLRWPFRWRMKLAANMRANSERSGASRMHITDVNARAVQALFERYDAHGMIQGHTHRPCRHDERYGASGAAGSPDSATATARIRWVLADWELDETPPRGGYLRLDANGLQAILLVGAG